MIACGVWPASRGLVAVLIDSAGRARSFLVVPTDEARRGLAQRLAAVGAELVRDEALAGSDRIAVAARNAGVTVWIARPLATSSGSARRGRLPLEVTVVSVTGVLDSKRGLFSVPAAGHRRDHGLRALSHLR